jgi:hypothetical protein
MTAECYDEAVAAILAADDAFVGELFDRVVRILDPELPPDRIGQPFMLTVAAVLRKLADVLEDPDWLQGGGAEVLPFVLPSAAAP